MFITVLLAISALLFVVSFCIEKRRFRNAVYLLITLSFLFLKISEIFFRLSLEVIPLIILFALVPLCLDVISFTFITCGIISLRREGFCLSHAVSILFGIGMWVPFLFAIPTYSLEGQNMFQQGLFYLDILVFMFYFYVIFTFISLFLYSLLYQIIPKGRHCDYIIVLGAGLLDGERVSPLLAGRINKAIKVSKKMKNNPMFIVSGGQGADEKISEARAMADYMIEHGVESDRILLEDKSTTTLENLKFSKAIMDSRSQQDNKYKSIFVTNNYHVFRGSMYASKLKLKANGVGCKTAFYYWPNAFVREYIAIILHYKAVPIILFSIWLLGTIISNLPFNL